MEQTKKRWTRGARMWLLAAGTALGLALAWFIWTGFGGGLQIGQALGPERAPYYQLAPFEESTPGVKRFHIYATDGLHPLPSGGAMYIWGFSSENRQGTATLPAPSIVVNEGDQVEIVFTNLDMKHPDVLGMSHSIHLHGLDVPESVDGVFTPVEPGESFTYSFTATTAGTYWYHCHVDTIQHLTMGMYGSLVVRARDGVAQAWTGGPSYDREFTFLLSESDPVVHSSVEGTASYDRSKYDPRFFFINGHSFPDVMDHPSDMIRGEKGETALIRLINAGYTWKSMHLHGFHFDVIASDGRPLPYPMTKDTLSIGPGERYDLLVKFDQPGTYPFHSHAIVDNLNRGQYPGGIHTMAMVDDGQTKATHDHGATPPAGKTDLTKVSYLKIGEARAHAGGVPTLLSARPVAIDKEIMVDVVFAAKALQAELTVDELTKSVVLLRAAKSVRLTAEADSAVTDQGNRALTAPARFLEQSLQVPLRFLVEYFNVPIASNLTGEELLIGTTSTDTLLASRLLIRPPVIAVAVAPSAPSPIAPAGAAGATDPGSKAQTEAQPVSSLPAPAQTTPGETQIVFINNRSYDPPEVRIRANTSLLWLNHDSAKHNVTHRDELFRSMDFLRPVEFEYAFMEPGVYEYFCNIHPDMQGKVVVTQ